MKKSKQIIKEKFEDGTQRITIDGTSHYHFNLNDGHKLRPREECNIGPMRGTARSLKLFEEYQKETEASKWNHK